MQEFIGLAVPAGKRTAMAAGEGAAGSDRLRQRSERVGDGLHGGIDRDVADHHDLDRSPTPGGFEQCLEVFGRNASTSASVGENQRRSPPRSRAETSR